MATASPKRMTELRCPNKLQGLLVEGLIEVKCDSRFCGAMKGVTVLHRFDPHTGELVETLKFQDPPRKGEVNNGSACSDSALRLPGCEADAV